MTVAESKLRAWWAHRQGLDGSMMGRSAAEVLAAAGWARSVGGATPYLALFARAGLRCAEVDAAVAKCEIHELPSARGCTYVLPACDYALGLRVGQGFSGDQEMKTARKLGVTDEEIANLRAAVRRALEKGNLDPDELRAAVGAAARSLGPEGVKKGMATTLPLALGQMQSEGEIRRISKNGRLDHQRYSYALWEVNPMADEAEAFTELARRYFAWAGPATPADFQWFSGLGVKASKAAAEPLGLVAIDDEGRLIRPEEREAFEKFRAPSEPRYELVGSIDPMIPPRRYAGELEFTRNQSTVLDLPCHAILDRGRLVGLWEYDPGAGSIAWMSFEKADGALREAVLRTEAYVREDLGDARGFSLDSPKSRAPRIEALRAGRLP